MGVGGFLCSGADSQARSLLITPAAWGPVPGHMVTLNTSPCFLDPGVLVHALLGSFQCDHHVAFLPLRAFRGTAVALLPAPHCSLANLISTDLTRDSRNLVPMVLFSAAVHA
jgi:hypothetical protein